MPSVEREAAGMPSSLQTARSCAFRSAASRWAKSAVGGSDDSSSTMVAASGSAGATARPLTVSVAISAAEVREDVPAEQPQLLMPAVAPQLEHDVRAAGVSILLDRLDAVARRTGDRLAALEKVVRDFLLGRQAAAALHRLGHRRQLLHLDAGELPEPV